MTTPNYPEHLARADRLLTADELRQKYYDPSGAWDSEGEHPMHGKWDWLQQVAQRSTLRGYWDWVQAQIEEEE